MRNIMQIAPDQNKCHRKVEWLWQYFGREGTAKEDVWLEGSSIINLAEWQRQLVQQFCHELEASSLRDRLRSTPSDLNSNFRLEEHEQDTGSHTSDGDPSSTKLEERNKLAHDAENSQSSPRTYHFRSIGVQNSDMFPDPLCSTSALSIEIDKNAKLMAEKEAKLTAQQHWICHLESELSATQKEYGRLLRDIDDSNDSPHNPEVLHKLRNDNSALKRQLQDIRASQSNELLVKSNSLGPTKSWICDELDWLEDRLAKTCSAFGCSSSSIKVLSEESVRLRQLITRVSGMPIQQFNTYISSTGISDHQVARSLAAALVCELAFESSFPDSLGSDSLVLHGYREQILVQGDHSALESLDLLAHNSLFSDQYFLSKMIPEKSRDLATEIFQLLVQWNYHESQNQHFGLAASVPKNELFQPIFARALAMKAKLLLSKSHYTLVFPATGTEFNPTTMRRHTWRYGGYDPRDLGSQLDLDESSVQPKREVELVKLCLFPALYAYQKPPSDETLLFLKVNTQRHVFNYRNFFLEDSEPIRGERMIISKAIVQL